MGLFAYQVGSLKQCNEDNAELTESEKHPAMLDTGHHVTSLIIKDCHERVHHNSVKASLTELRSKFWLIRGRQFVRKVLHGCITCQRLEGKAYGAPDPPPLPSFRITKDHLFAYTGVDFAGPLYIKHSVKALFN